MCGMQKLLDDMSLARADLEAQQESLKEEQLSLKSNHEQVWSRGCRLTGRALGREEAPPTLWLQDQNLGLVGLRIISGSGSESRGDSVGCGQVGVSSLKIGPVNLGRSQWSSSRWTLARPFTSEHVWVHPSVCSSGEGFRCCLLCAKPFPHLEFGSFRPRRK